MTLIEACELLMDAEQLAPRLDAAATALAQLPDLADEGAWLAAARERLASVLVKPFGPLLDRVVRLPELELLRGERGRAMQGAIADGFERLQASITLAGGPRCPLLEVLLLNLKVPVLRKCARGDVQSFSTEIERRLASSYTVRILATERYLAVVPTVHELRAAIGIWRSVFVEAAPSDEEAAALRDELLATAGAVEVVVRQARLLAQAALVPAADLLDAAGVVKKRRVKGPDPDSHPILETDPPDPSKPSPGERAEIAVPWQA